MKTLILMKWISIQMIQYANIRLYEEFTARIKLGIQKINKREVILS